MQDFILPGERFATELKEVFSSVPCGLGVYRFADGKITPVFHNPAFYEIMGYSEENRTSIQSTTSFLGVHPEDEAMLRQKIAEMVKDGGIMRHTYRVYNDAAGEYRYICLDGSVKTLEDGSRLLYGVYSDVSDRVYLENELAAANDKMQDIINAIPGGVAIYKMSDIFETVYFSDGVPELSGYTVEEYYELIKGDASQMTYYEDTKMVVEKLRKAVRDRETADFEFRKLHRDGHIVWVHIQARQIGEEDGCPLIHCVFHNISALKESQLRMEHLVNSIPGGIAIYQVEGEKFIPVYFSDGVTGLSGHSREEYEVMTENNALDIIYSHDRERVLASAKQAILTGEVLDVSYRMHHKKGHLIWIHLSGRSVESTGGTRQFYAVFTGMSAETRLFQSIADETADGIYVIDKENYDLLYANESMNLFLNGQKCSGQKCYEALHRKKEPCAFCTLGKQELGEAEYEMVVDNDRRIFGTKLKETDWNGIPAYVKYVRDITQETNAKKEIERLEQYYRNIIRKLPGGVAVVRCERDGKMVPEFLSEGFAAMTGMTWEQAFELYKEDAMAGVHPDDKKRVCDKMEEHMEKGEGNYELVYRLKKGEESYIWVKNTLSYSQSEDGIYKIYAMYRDVTQELEEQERIKKQYQDMLIQHYRMPDPNALIVGHCNITQSRILELIDYTHSDLFGAFGTEREGFFRGIASFIVEEEERRAFLAKYLNCPTIEAFQRGDTEQKLTCFVRFPKDTAGRYVQVKVNLVESPVTGDLTGILTITDITEQIISDRILQQLSITSYDFVADINLQEDTYHVLVYDKQARGLPGEKGKHSERIEKMISALVVPKDRKHCEEYMDRDYMLDRLRREGSYSFHYAMLMDNGEVLTKNLSVSAIDLRLGRVCLARTDITETVQEQQGLLNMIAYTFELACFINTATQRLMLYTRETVLENLPPRVVDNYNQALERFVEDYTTEEEIEEARKNFRLETLLESLEKKPEGYDFVFSLNTDAGMRYKQINVLWGDENHRTVCLVRADVTDMLINERRTKKELEATLAFANEANRAKSDFLSAMSHDIRTPMNAIMGMTTLALAHLDNREQVENWLQKISLSSRHLLSLINDVLDMSKIENAKITLNRMKISLPELTDQLIAILAPQARTYGLSLRMRAGIVPHEHFYGDSLRINQILINILSNAVKFTPPGGKVDFYVDELENAGRPGWARYRFTVRDTGIGMSEEFMKHLFEPFTRSSNSDVGRIEGTGLGLSITKGLVDLMGGSISVESRVKEGTTFHVELEMEYADSKKEDFSSYLPLEVLIVNEEEKCCRRIGRTLALAGIRSHLVYEPGQIAALEKEEIETKASVVILNGKLLSRGLLHTGRLPVVILSDYDDVPQVKENAKKNGDAYFMNKPFFLTGFHTLLEKIYPEAETAIGPKVQKYQEENIFQGRHFLVAEDNEINAEILSELMDMYGAKVSIRQNGRLAVLAFRESEPGTYDGILMDIQMPEMDGYEAARTIRAQKRPDAGTIPIIAMTANAFAEDVQAALKAGMNAHVAKPIDMDILRETLGRLL